VTAVGGDVILCMVSIDTECFCGEYGGEGMERGVKSGCGDERVGEKKRLSLRGKSTLLGEMEERSGERSQFLVGGPLGMGDAE